jgi:hypothetical protein
MALTGKDLVSLIQGTLENEARRDQQVLRDEMAAFAFPVLQKFGIEKNSDEIFDLYRSIDMIPGAPDAKSKIKREVFDSRLLSWGISEPNATWRVDEQLGDKYSELRTRLFGSRSLTAHVGAVLRPFRRRYLDTWAEAGIPGFSLNAVSVKVEELATQRIQDENDLQGWAESVYGLFSDTAVFRRALKEAGIKRPMGMIGSGSERTYKQQWFAWIRASGAGLLAHLKDSESGKLDHAMANRRGFNQSAAPGVQHQSPDFVANFASSTLDSPALHQRRQFDEPATASFMMPPESPVLQHTTELIIRVSDSIEPTLVADRSWSDKKTAIQDVEAWVSNLIRFWGGPERIASVQIEFKEAGNESTFPLPPLPLGQIASVITSAIASYR